MFRLPITTVRHLRHTKCRGMFLGLIAAVVLAAAPMVAWAEEKTPARPKGDTVGYTYVGDLKGAPAGSKVAVVVLGDEVTAYVCSADEGFNQKESHWYKGTLAGCKCSARVEGREFSAEIKGDKCSVSIQSGDKKYTSEAAEAGDSEAGLYRLEDKQAGETRVVGWIRSSNGGTVGAARVGVKKQVQKAPADLAGDRLPLLGNKVVIKSVTSVGGAGGAGESRDFKIIWDASVTPTNKILSFEASLKANYTPSTNPPFIKPFKGLAKTTRSLDVRVPEIAGQFTVSSFTVVVSMVVESQLPPPPSPKGTTPPRAFRVTATKSGTP